MRKPNVFLNLDVEQKYIFSSLMDIITVGRTKKICAFNQNIKCVNFFYSYFSMRVRGWSKLYINEKML